MSGSVEAESAGAGAPEGGGHGTRTPVDDHKVPWRVFGVIGLVLGAIGGIYWATAYENAGTVMLLVAAILAFWVGGYLWLRQRAPDEAPALEPQPAPAPPSTTAPGAGEPAEATATAAPTTAPAATTAPGDAAATTAVPAPATVHGVEEEHYLPHASVWPFVIGLGGAAIAVGIVLGLWVAVPGVAFLALGVGGFVGQTRRRD